MTYEASSAVADITQARDALGVLELAESDAESIERLQALEELKAACAAAQARETAALQARRRQAEADRGVPAARRCNGLGAEVGLARGDSPARGARHLRVACALVEDLPNTMQALQSGRIHEEHAQIVVKETSWLAADHRRQVDALIADRLGTLGPRKLATAVQGYAQELDQLTAVEQRERAESERRVSMRPAPGGMTYLSALVPMQQAVGIYAGLRRDATNMVGTGETADPADPSGQPRTRDQIMADLLVQRLTGQATARAVPAEVHVVMTDEALFGDGDTPAWLIGHGPIPASTALQWIADPEADMFLRRVFTRPEDHQLVGLESRSRSFPPGLRRMVALRDDTCRTPYCDAAIQDIDHILAVKDGGTTSWSNAQGLCGACNQIKENTGWRHEATADQLTVTTPTGHRYTTNTAPIRTAKDPPGPGSRPDARPPDDNPPPTTLSSCAMMRNTTQYSIRVAA